MAKYRLEEREFGWVFGESGDCTLYYICDGFAV
jgi:hypothetical protein